MRSRAGWDSPRQLHHEGCDGLGCGKISRRREPILECPFPADVAENVQFGMERQSRAREKIIILECGHFAWERWPTLRKRSILFADLPRSRMRPDQLPPCVVQIQSCTAWHVPMPLRQTEIQSR